MKKNFHDIYNRCIFCNSLAFTWNYASISACFNCWKEYKVNGEDIVNTIHIKYKNYDR